VLRLGFLADGRRRTFTGAAVVFVLAILGGCGEPAEGVIDFVSPTCSCVDGNINVRVDGVSQGIMLCGSTLSSPVEAGDHTVEATDRTGGWGPSAVSVGEGATFRYELSC
jgi:hypothetical protein